MIRMVERVREREIKSVRERKRERWREREKEREIYIRSLIYCTSTYTSMVFI